MSEQFKIKPRIQSLADRIVPLSKVNKENVSEDDGIFRKVATEDGRDVDKIVDDQEYISDFLAANTLAQGIVAEKHLKTHKDVNTVSGSFEIGRSTMEVSFERHSKAPNRIMDKETGNFKVDGEKDLWGDSAVKYKVRGAQNSKGDLKAVRDQIQSNFKSAFSS